MSHLCYVEKVIAEFFLSQIRGKIKNKKKLKFTNHVTFATVKFFCRIFFFSFSFRNKMVLHMVDLVSSPDVLYEDCPTSGGSFTGLEDFNMNNCLNTTTMIPGRIFLMSAPTKFF